jgi:acyl-CoA synthetase (AMP-forming)/AMP-acid ligase II
MRVWLNGGEPVRADTGGRFLDAFAVAKVAPRSYTPAYGLAEATVLVSATRPDSPGTVLRVDAAALERNEVVLVEPDESGARTVCGDGVAAPGQEIAIVDPARSTPVAPGTVGEVWLRGPSVCPGYWKRPVETADTFGGRIVGDDRGPWLRTGDLGFMHGDELVICGRVKDLIIVHGRNIHPQDIEFVAEFAHPAVRLGAAAAFAVQDAGGGDVPVIIAEVDGEPDTDEVRAAISTAVRREFELHVADVLLVGPRQVPKTSSGKKQRTASRALWQRARDERPLTAS